jgi:hypothetical protein
LGSGAGAASGSAIGARGAAAAGAGPLRLPASGAPQYLQKRARLSHWPPHRAHVSIIGRGACGSAIGTTGAATTAGTPGDDGGEG